MVIFLLSPKFLIPDWIFFETKEIGQLFSEKQILYLALPDLLGDRFTLVKNISNLSNILRPEQNSWISPRKEDNNFNSVKSQDD